MTLLEVDGVSVRFGGVEALRDVSLRVHAGEIVGLIGPNGAGKTTLFNCVSGTQRPGAGGVSFAGADVTAAPVPERARLGIGRTFQLLRTFAAMTVADNLAVASYTGVRGGLAGDVLRLPGARRAERTVRERVRVVAAFAGIEPLLGARCGDLPFGAQRKVELARALCLRPRLLLLDEAASGLDTDETGAFAGLVLRARDAFGCAVLWIEHDVPLIRDVAEYVYVLDFGALIAEGTPAEVVSDPSVREAYVGTDPVAARAGGPR